MSTEYANKADIFLFDMTIKLLENTDISKYVIKLVENKQPLYNIIYAFSLVKLEILKAYIKTQQKTEFI